MIPSRSCGLGLQHEAGRTCDAWPQPSPEGPVAALDAEGSTTRGHPPSRSRVLGHSRHGLRDPVLRQVQEDHPVRASHHPPGRQVASDLGTLGTLGTSLGRAGRIRKLLGALGAVLERVVRMWRDPPKRRSSPGSTGAPARASLASIELPTAKVLDKTAMPRGANVKPKDRGSQ